MCTGALDNGVLSCERPAKAQALCEAFSAEKIAALLRKWLRALLHPFSAADRRAGYRYDISILQAEFSLTQVLDRPACGPHDMPMGLQIVGRYLNDRRLLQVTKWCAAHFP